MLRICHLADVHYRSQKRHAEYDRAFRECFESVEKLGGADVVVVLGDVWHTKVYGLVPESIDALRNFFELCSRCAPTHVVLGNHDFLVGNANRQDALSPLIRAMSNERIALHKETKLVSLAPGYTLGVFSLADSTSWKNLRPEPSCVNIAAYHGPVAGAQTETGWELESDISTSFFDGWQFGFLGDVHNFQFLGGDRRIAYPGSPIPQSYGEEGEHGFLYWQIESADSFDVKFVPIRSSIPFVTVQWNGTPESTACADVLSGARVRVRHTEDIGPVDAARTRALLTERRAAEEVVFQRDSVDRERELTDESLGDMDDWSRDACFDLFREFCETENVASDDRQRAEELFGSLLQRALEGEEAARGAKWTIEKLEFDNTFGFGSNNVIDFSELSGVVGLFGKNRSGKSSLIGSLVYALFNSTSRGVARVNSVINSREQGCRARAIVTRGTKRYEIDRSSKRYAQKNGYRGTTTSLSFFELDASGNRGRNLVEAQRSDTDKAVREIIGSSSDFLLTGLSPQGWIDHFLDIGKTARGAALGKLLGIDVFEKMHKLSQAESRELKNRARALVDRDWESVTKAACERAEQARFELNRHRARRDSCAQRRDEAVHRLADLESAEIVSAEEFAQMQLELDRLRADSIAATESARRVQSDVDRTRAYAEQAEERAADIDASALRSQIFRVEELERALGKKKEEHQRAAQQLTDLRKSVENLSSVPCGELFPSCKYIKQSHADKRHLPVVERELKQRNTEMDEATAAVVASDASEQRALLETRESLIAESARLRREESTLVARSMSESARSVSLVERVRSGEERLAEAKKKLASAQLERDLADARSLVRKAENERTLAESALLASVSELAVSERAVQELEDERAREDVLKKEWKLLELVQRALGRDGIPRRVLSATVPRVNEEIAAILDGVCDFTVVLELDRDSMETDVIIDYGSTRYALDESGSGMERMIGSLALRVALLSVSQLPKPDFLVVDEGFGVLDPEEQSTCSRFLHTLRRSFRFLLVVTHVDAIKDAVDSVIEVERDDDGRSKISGLGR